MRQLEIMHEFSTRGSREEGLKDVWTEGDSLITLHFRVSVPPGRFSSHRLTALGSAGISLSLRERVSPQAADAFARPGQARQVHRSPGPVRSSPPLLHVPTLHALCGQCCRRGMSQPKLY